MRALFTFVLLFYSLLTYSYVDDLSKPNPYYHNVINPFLQALNIDSYQISLNRDSARVKLYDKSYIDIFIIDKKLWNLKRYDKNNQIVNIGNFKNGEGKVIMKFKATKYIAKFKNGFLNDTVAFLNHNFNQWNYRSIHIFKEGFLQGNSYDYSLIDYKVISGISTYDKGLLKKRDQFGIKTQYIIPFPFLFSYQKHKIKYADKMCSRTIYEKGKVVSHECFITKKCRRCGY